MVRDTEPGAEASPRVRLGVGAVIVVVLLALAATVAIALFRGLGAPSEVVPLGESRGTVESVVDGKASDRGTESDGDADAIITRGEVYVHVFGAIQAPGLYRLGEGARVVDAVAAGGGFRDDAEPSAVNLARPLSDGEQLYLPTAEEAQAARAGGSAVGGAGVGGGGGATAPGAVGADGRINLNTASAAELDALPRIGPAMAQRIVAWRETNGRFTSIEDLLAVPGIGEKTLESFRALVFV